MAFAVGLGLEAGAGGCCLRFPKRQGRLKRWSRRRWVVLVMEEVRENPVFPPGSFGVAFPR